MIPDAAETKIRQMRAEGYSIATIALRCRIGLATVSRALAGSKIQGATAVNVRSRDLPPTDKSPRPRMIHQCSIKVRTA
jgi:hypothetical protein